MDVDGEIVLLDLGSSRYYSLNATGAWIWERLDSEPEFGTLLAELVATFEVDESTARTDLERHVVDLAADSLVLLS